MRVYVAGLEVRLATGIDAIHACGLELDRGRGVKGTVLAAVGVRRIVEIGSRVRPPCVAVDQLEGLVAALRLSVSDAT